MANRHILRTTIMQGLYELEFRSELKLPEIVERQLRAAGVGKEDQEYVDATVAGYLKNAKAIDKLIVKHAPEWPLDQIAAIDRCVLRLGIYEVLFSETVPPKVAINEAVEIAKAFGGENSGSFINGVLGTVYRASDKYDPKDDRHEAKDKKDDEGKNNKAKKAKD